MKTRVGGPENRICAQAELHEGGRARRQAESPAGLRESQARKPVPSLLGEPRGDAVPPQRRRYVKMMALGWGC